MITGRCPPRNNGAALSTAAASAPSPSHGDGSGTTPAPSSAASANRTSIGKSTNAGPERPDTAADKASWTNPGIAAVVGAVAANVVSGETNGTWSISCSEPCPQRDVGARPPSTSIGQWFCDADAIALVPLVTPGPAADAPTPGVRVTLAQPSAVNAPVRSCRP